MSFLLSKNNETGALRTWAQDSLRNGGAVLKDGGHRQDASVTDGMRRAQEGCVPHRTNSQLGSAVRPKVSLLVTVITQAYVIRSR